jgi:GNAT superfamily N-acetyltransferase
MASGSKPTYVPLTLATIDAALAFMEDFYAEEGLDYLESRAITALNVILDNPSCGLFEFIQVGRDTVGYFVLTRGISLEFGGPFALLDEFYLYPEYRGRGVGTQVLRYIKQNTAKLGLSALRLEVDRESRVRGLYERAGFVAHDRDLMTNWLSGPARGE